MTSSFEELLRISFAFERDLSGDWLFGGVAVETRWFLVESEEFDVCLPFAVETFVRWARFLAFKGEKKIYIN